MQIKNRKTLLIILAFVAGGILVGEKALYNPLMKAWRTRAAEVKKLREQVKHGEMLLARKESINSRWAEMQKQAFPPNESMAELLLATLMEKWHQVSRYQHDSTIPIWKFPDGDYKTLELRMDVSGNLDSIVRLLFELESDPAALRVESVVLRSEDKTGRLLSAQLLFSGLVLTPQPNR